MEQTQKSSRRLLWIGLIVVAIIIVGVSVAIYVMSGTTKQEAATTSPSPSPESTSIASEKDVQQDLSTAEARLKQAAADQTAAKAAAKDNEKQIKVGS